MKKVTVTGLKNQESSYNQAFMTQKPVGAAAL